MDPPQQQFVFNHLHNPLPTTRLLETNKLHVTVFPEFDLFRPKENFLGPQPQINRGEAITSLGLIALNFLVFIKCI